VSLKFSFSPTLKSSRNHSLKISTICLIVVKFQTCSLLMKKLLLLMSLVQKQEKLEKEIAETKFLLISSSSAVRICTLCLLSHQLENSSETDADNSLQSLIAAQSIGTIPGHLRLFTQWPIDNTLLTKSNLEFKSIWTLFALCLWQSITPFLRPLRDTMLS
jgi:hypothetical protein